MFPNVSGFEWSPGHLVFLGVFFTVILTVAWTLGLAWARARRDAREGRVTKIRWNSDFHDLPAADRVCRHELTGEFRERRCEKAFDCRECATHGTLVAAHPTPAAAEERPYGLPYPADRLYHRGHTWLREEADGTATIGLDELGRRLLGRPDEVQVPPPGARIEANGTAWTVRRRGVPIRILSPVDGEVVEAGVPGEDSFVLKVRPCGGEKFDTRHLLRGAEIAPWLGRELERLQMALSPAATGPALADGGVLMDDLPAQCPNANWDAVWGRLFLEP